MRRLAALSLLVPLAAAAPAQAASTASLSIPGYLVMAPQPNCPVGPCFVPHASGYSFGSAGAAQFISAGSLATATNLVVPPNALASVAEICVETAGVRYRDDGATFVGSISGTTLNVASVSVGALAIGEVLTDPTRGISAGTTITGGSGSSWTVNNSQTVASETIYGVTPPTATVGVPVVATAPAPNCFQYAGPLFAIEFIALSGSPTMDISFYYPN